MQRLAGMREYKGKRKCKRRESRTPIYVEEKGEREPH